MSRARTLQLFVLLAALLCAFPSSPGASRTQAPPAGAPVHQGNYPVGTLDYCGYLRIDWNDPVPAQVRQAFKAVQADPGAKTFAALRRAVGELDDHPTLVKVLVDGARLSGCEAELLGRYKARAASDHASYVDGVAFLYIREVCRKAWNDDPMWMTSSFVKKVEKSIPDDDEAWSVFAACHPGGFASARKVGDRLIANHPDSLQLRLFVLYLFGTGGQGSIKKGGKWVPNPDDPEMVQPKQVLAHSLAIIARWPDCAEAYLHAATSEPDKALQRQYAERCLKVARPEDYVEVYWAKYWLKRLDAGR